MSGSEAQEVTRPERARRFRGVRKQIGILPMSKGTFGDDLCLLEHLLVHRPKSVDSTCEPRPPLHRACCPPFAPHCCTDHHMDFMKLPVSVKAA